MDALLSVIFGALSLLALGLLTAYRHVSLREIKRRARDGEEQSLILHRAAAYGASLGALLWFIAGVGGGLFFWSLSRSAAGWLAVIIGSIFMWTILVWLPTRNVTRISMKLAVWLAPVLAALLNYLHNIIDPIVRFSDKYVSAHQHTGLYDTYDLLDMLEAQRSQTDSRIDAAELGIALNALTFRHRRVREIMTPRSAAKTVSADDHLGPVLMTELHESGQTNFPVYDGKEDHIVGTLTLESLVNAQAAGPVKQYMQPEPRVLQEGQALTETLESILQPGSHVFIVVNDLKEYVGIITAESILRQIIGSPDAHEFEAQTENIDQEPEADTPTEPSTEVVE